MRKWLNIYRIDDFIGTKMDVDEVGDVNVGLGGHANYWSDSRIVPHILAAIHTEAERKAEIQLGDALAR